MEAQARFIPTKYGGENLEIGGYIYSKDSTNNGRTYWRCVRRGECSARCSTDNDGLVAADHNFKNTHMVVALEKVK